MFINFKSVDLYLLQEKVALHKAVAEKSSRSSTVLEKARWVGASSGVGAHQLTVMRDQSFGDLWAQREHKTVNNTSSETRKQRPSNAKCI